MNQPHVASVTLAALLLSCANAPAAEAPASPLPSAATTTPAGAAGTGASGASAPAAPQAAAATAGAASTTASGLQMPALEAGFKRFVAPPVDVPGGTTDDWIQWVDGPMDQDYDVIQLKGAQSKGGHHALMLAVGEANMPGFTRKYSERDQLSSSSVGGIGAEGNVAIPEGVVFRLRKGSYLAIQSHYLNTTEENIQGETYIDIQMTPKNAANTVAGHFASTSLKIALPPKAQTSQDVYCDVLQDIPILRMTNHMHYAGVSTYTEYTDPAGMTHMLKKDDVWTEDWALTPNYDNFPVSAPFTIPAGSKLHTNCIWNNSGDKMVGFPEEMCVFATIILGEREISCIDGQFVARDAESMSAAAPAPAAGAAGAAGGAPAAGAAGAAAAPSGDGACTNDADRAVLDAPAFEESQRNCARMCLGLEASCSIDCLAKNTTLSAGCATCNGNQLSCAMTHCVGDCAAGFMSASCMPCLETNCGADYHACSGL
jgi:hypothetical protein